MGAEIRIEDMETLLGNVSHFVHEIVNMSCCTSQRVISCDETCYYFNTHDIFNLAEVSIRLFDSSDLVNRS